MTDYTQYKITQGTANTSPLADPVLGSNGTEAVIKYNGLIDALNTQIAALDASITALSGSISTINTTLTSLDNRIAALEAANIDAAFNDSITFHIELPAEKTYVLDSSSCLCTDLINIKGIKTLTGTLTATFRKNGVGIAGLTNLAVNTTPGTYLPSSATSFEENDQFDLVITNLAGGADLVGSICLTKKDCP